MRALPKAARVVRRAGRVTRGWGTWRMDRVQIYPAPDGWRWRFRAAGNGEIMAVSSEGYVALKDCQAAARRVCPWTAYEILDVG